MVLIIDTETSGLEGYPKDRVLEVGICELDDESGEITPLYDEIIHYDDIVKFDRDYRSIDGRTGELYSGCWVFHGSDMSIEDVLNAEKDLATVSEEVREIVRGKEVTSYNVPFDFDRFLSHDPWILLDFCILKGDIMVTASERVREMFEKGETPEKFHRYLSSKVWDHPDLHTRSVAASVAYEILCPDNPMGLERQAHRALDDAVMEAHILSAIRR